MFDPLSLENRRRRVFVRTNLNTPILMFTCKEDRDTVSDFKKKIVSSHAQCYPDMKISIRSLKIKHGDIFYCLPGKMLVWDAFHGATEDWVLTVDAASEPPAAPKSKT